MNDMSHVIVPKSDQINADDLIAGPMTITIRDVQIKGGQEQPVSIFFDGSDKAFRPCKSMSRVLVQAWGADAKNYIGRSLTLYRDPTVKWGGLEVGGIRISHMSHIDGVKMMMLTATKGSRKPHKVMPLVDAPPAKTTDDPAAKWAAAYIAKLATLDDLSAVQAFAGEKAAKLAELQTARPELHAKVAAAVEARTSELGGLSTFDDDDLTSGPAPAAQPATLLDEVDQGATQQSGEDQAAARANAIIDEIKASNAVMDVKAIQAREETNIDELPKPIADTIDAVAAARIAEIEAAREKAKEAAE